MSRSVVVAAQASSVLGQRSTSSGRRGDRRIPGCVGVEGPLDIGAKNLDICLGTEPVVKLEAKSRLALRGVRLDREEEVGVGRLCVDNIVLGVEVGEGDCDGRKGLAVNHGRVALDLGSLGLLVVVVEDVGELAAPSRAVMVVLGLDLGLVRRAAVKDGVGWVIKGRDDKCVLGKESVRGLYGVGGWGGWFGCLRC